MSPALADGFFTIIIDGKPSIIQGKMQGKITPSRMAIIKKNLKKR